MLFALTLCTMVMFLAPAFSAQWASATQPGLSWTPPAPTPIPFPTPISPTPPPTATPPPTVSVSPGAPSTPPTSAPAFKAGDMVTNVNKGPVNLRKTPGYLNKPNSDRIGLVPSGAQLRIIGGPEQKDALTWWQVQWDDKSGWMAERTASGVLILQLAE